jgi:hypothetical protein
MKRLDAAIFASRIGFRWETLRKTAILTLLAKKRFPPSAGAS